MNVIFMRKKSLVLTLIIAFSWLLGGGDLMGQSGTSLPYEENFDSSTVGITPSGWSAISGSATVYTSSTPTYLHSGSNCLRISNSSTGDRIIALPQFENDITTLQISCYHVAGGSTHGSLEIGYIVEASGETSFTSITTYLASSSTVYQEVEVSMATAPSGARIAFHHTGTGTYQYWYIDDVIVETIPTNPKPKNLVGTPLTNSKTSLNWTNGGSETAWQVVYSTTESFDPNDLTPIDVNTNPATISGLSGSTTYYACVRAKIDAETFSRWSYKCSFTTRCDPEYSFPFSEEFKYYSGLEVPECWDNSTGNFYNDSYKWKIQSGYGADGSNKGFIQMALNGSSGTYYYYLTSRMMNIPDENMKLSFYFKKTNQSKGRLDVYISVDGVISNTPIASDISVSSTNWELKEIDLPNEYKNTDNIAIVFKGTSAGGSYNLCIDDVRMEIVYSCVKPTGLAVSSITSSSATLSWTDGGQGSWDVYYSTSSIAPDQETLPTASVDNNSCTLSLEPHKKYYAWVRGNCGVNDISSWSDAISFSTSTTLPYSYDFTDETELYAWTLYDCVSSTGINVSGSNSYLRFVAGSPNPQHLITPLFENNSNAVLVSFDYKLATSTVTYPILNVGYSTSNINSFTWPSSATIEVSSAFYQKFECILPIEEIKYIAIKYDKNGTYTPVDIDNVSFTPINKVYTGGGEVWDNLSDWTPAGLPSASDDIYINNSITIEDDVTATAHNIILGPSGSLTIADGGQLICNNAVEATVHKTIAAWNTGLTGGWYFIASPINVNNLAPTNVTNMISDANAANGDRTYDLYSLDNITWHNYRANPFNLANGRGYLYASEGGADLQFSGAIKAYDADHTIPVSEGWNLIGNPYTFEAYPNQAYYTINDANSGITAQTSTSNAVVAPCTGIIIKAAEDGTVKFLKDAPETSTNNGNLQMVLAHKVATRDGASVNKNIDNAIVSFNEGSQLEKFYFGNPSASIFIPQNGEDYAIAFSDRQGDVPLYFKANETGTYTISFAGDEMNLNGIYLIDILAEEEIDLSVNPSYTFIGSPADRMARFKIVFRNTGDGTSDIFAYQNGNDIIVSGEGELQIFDVMGRMVSRQYVSGVGTINAMPYGVYIFKLNDKTQKIVVR